MRMPQIVLEMQPYCSDKNEKRRLMLNSLFQQAKLIPQAPDFFLFNLG